MKKIRFLFLMMAVLLFFHCGAARTVYADGYPDFVSMSTEEFIRWNATNAAPVSSQGTNYFVKLRQIKYSGLNANNYDWANASAMDVSIIKRLEIPISYKESNPAFAAALNRWSHSDYGWFDERHSEQTSALLKIQTEKLWAASELTGNDNSTGAIKKEPNIYSRTESNGQSKPNVIYGVDIGGNGASNSIDKPSGVTEIVMDFLGYIVYYVASWMDDILSGAGIALDNVIFGRVAGYGVLMGGRAVSLFTFELETGNPYGFVAAVIFQKIRLYIYSLLSIICLFKLVKIAVGGDYAKMCMDFKAFLMDAVLAFSFMVLMPYILDIYLYCRDILLRNISLDVLTQLFGNTSFLGCFRDNAIASNKELIPSFLYLGAVGVSIFIAGIYISYAMSMMIHFSMFPFVCMRGMFNRSAYTEWCSETVGLTIMPIADSLVLTIPLAFSHMANGNIAFNFLALVACFMIMTVRQQVRKTLGIRDTGLDMGAIGTVLGIGRMAGGMARTAKKTAGKIRTASETMADAKQDDQMSKYYAPEKKKSGEGAVTDGIKDPVAESSVGSVKDPVAASAVKEDAVSSSKAEKYASVGNFENPAFRDKLSDETMSKLYKQRAAQKRRKAFVQMAGAAGTAIGGIGGGLIAGGATTFLGASASAAAAGMGMDFGNTMGGLGAEGVVSSADALIRGGVYVGKFAKKLYHKGDEGHYEKLPDSDEFYGSESRGPADIPPSTPFGTPKLENRTKMIGDESSASKAKHGGSEYFENERNIQIYNELSGNNFGNAREYMNTMSFTIQEVEDTSNQAANYGINKIAEDSKKDLESLVTKVEESVGKGQPMSKKERLRAFNDIHSNLDESKVVHLRTRYQNKLEANSNLKYDGANEACNSIKEAIVRFQTRAEKNEEGKAPGKLREGGRYLTEEFDKNKFNIDWNDYRRRILGDNYGSGKKG